MAAAEPSKEAELAELRKRMVRHTAASEVSYHDAEDLTQEALLRVIQPSQSTEVALPIRAFRKLKDVRAEFYRSPKREFANAAQPLEEQPDLAREAAAFAVIGIEDMIESLAGPDVRAYIRLKALRLTDAEIAKQLKWTPQRVDAARKQYSRKMPAILKEMGETAS